jgi:hypothetical protein
MNDGLAQPGAAGLGLPHADRDQPRAMRGKFPSTSALAFTVMRNAAQARLSTLILANYLFGQFLMLTALRLRRS